MEDKFKYTVIGAGIIGLAIAKEISKNVKDDYGVLVVEKENSFGQGISSRNSEVVHAGIYYPTGSLKHKLCIEGRKLLYDYCKEKNIPYNKCGKLIIATSNDELQSLNNVYEQSKLNQVENVTKITKEEALKLEPDINAYEALFSKETGIIDTHSFMSSLEKEIKNNNGTLAYSSKVINIKYDGNMYSIELNDGSTFLTEYLINSSGLNATQTSRLLGLDPEKMFPCKGSYFSYNGKIKCNHLVYPVPESNLTGLGIHATIDLGGRLKFGPDIEYINNTNDYSVNNEKRQAFYESAKKIFNNIEADELMPDMAGIRPKIQGPNDKNIKDFYIKEGKAYPKLINLLGIESPGLTSSLSIGRYIWDNLLK